ncbi:MAG: L-rhamnose isomerase [Planctomycetes bacterium]|nr:L-rhamnose isomerase [Planctomycetota bacterium]
MKSDRKTTQAYTLAKSRYIDLGVNTDHALKALAQTPISLNCWQGDDVSGFEAMGNLSDGGLAVTGNYPGRARTPDELRSDLSMALSLIPGQHRVNLHAIYAETAGRKVERDALEPAHFQGWIDWAGQNRLGLDFNPTFFAHAKASDGFTLSHADKGVRAFWIAHGIACRRIAAAMGRALGMPCVNNLWIPDGFKDLPADRKAPRERLIQSLDKIFEEKIDPHQTRDSVESKLFGIGSESYVTGSHEFYLGYAITRGLLLCLDTGHFHPTESVADKISAILPWVPGILLHVSRGVRWDSDHVVILSDEIRTLAEELVRGEYLDRVRIGLDFFDASINRTAAWVIGGRSVIKALLLALLEPRERLMALEKKRDFTGRLALSEECKTLPFGAVWDHYCIQQDVPPGEAWLDAVRVYEKKVLSKRQ